MKFAVRRPSPALVIACIALFVSLGGVSYGLASGSIDSRELKNNTIRSKDVRNNTLRTFDIRNSEVRGFDIRNSTIGGRDVAFNTLTGADIDEAELGKVPSATAADSAATAGGVTPKAFSYAGQAGSGFVEVFALGGLTLEASCGAGPVLSVRATTTAVDSEISSDEPPAVDESDLDPGETPLVVNDLAAAGAIVSIAYAGSDGRTVTASALARQEADTVRGTTNDCGFFGIAHAG